MQVQDLQFRQAGHADTRAIVEIHNVNVRNQASSNPRGFLLTKTTEEEVTNALAGKTQYFIGDTSAGEVVGFVAVSRPTITNEFLDKIHWQDEELRQHVLKPNHLYIQTAATKPEYMGQGVAQFLYQSLYEQFPQSWLSAFIVAKPITNYRSITFHQKQGFETIGTLYLEEFLDLQHYESLLMLKATL